MIYLSIINLVLIVFLAGVVFLMVRQLGLVVAVTLPKGFRHDPVGPRVGEIIPREILPLDSKELQLVIFGSKSCSVCNYIKNSGLEEIARAWLDRGQVLYVADEDSIEQQDSSFYRTTGGGKKIREMLSISFVPFGMVVDVEGKVLQKGLVNDPSHVENLLEMAEALIRKTPHTPYAR